MVPLSYARLVKNASAFGKKAVLPFSIALLFSSPAMADCGTRHFYNHSRETFTLFMGDAGTCSILNASGKAPNVRGCEIPPGQTAEIHYDNTYWQDAMEARNNVGTITVRSKDYRKEFKVLTTLCYIKHDGNTGAVSVNDPVDGDISA